MRISLHDAAMEIGRTAFVRVVATAMLAAIGLWSAATVDAQEQVDALAQKARESFQPLSAEQVSAARAKLEQQMRALEQFVGPRSTNGKRWLKYLQWDALKQALSAEGRPKVEALDATLSQLNRDVNGLELPKFRAVADALKRYRDLVFISQLPNVADVYGQQLNQLTKSLAQFKQDRAPANEVALVDQLAFVSAVGQAPELVAAVREEFGRPNAFVDVSGQLLAAAAEPINRKERITDNILGTSIQGTARTTGKVEITPMPSDKAAVLELKSSGHSTTQNVGHNGPAVIRSTGHTDFSARKRVELSDREFRSQAARVNATTDTDIHSISKSGGGLGGRMVSKIGWQRARESEGQAEAIASDHAETRIARRFDQEVRDKLRDARKRYEDEYRRPLARRGELPDHIQFSSTKDALLLEVTQAGRGQLAAAADPPANPNGHDMTMRVHESAVNNYSGVLLGGATISQTEPGQESKFDVTMPKWLKDAWAKRKTEATDNAAANEPFKPWSLRLRRGRPISVDFADNKVKLTLHIARLESGSSDPFRNWDVSGTFIPESTDGGLILRREGPLDAMPTGSRGALENAQVQGPQRNNLLKEFESRSAKGEGFPNKIEFGRFEPEGALENAGPLEVTDVATNDGWLVLVWDRAAKSHSPPANLPGG